MGLELNKDIPQELHTLLLAASEETLSEEQGIRLDAMLRQSDAAIDIYVRYMAMCADLRSRVEPLASGGAGGAESPDSVAWRTATAIYDLMDPAANNAASESHLEPQDPRHTVYGFRVTTPEAHDESDEHAAPATSEEEQPWALAAPPQSTPTVISSFPNAGLSLGRRGAKPGSLNFLHALPQINLKLWAGIAAAIAMIAGLSIVVHSIGLRRSSGPEEIASLTATADAKWVVEPATLTDNRPIKTGTRLQLASGYAELHYTNGTNLVLEGPCDVGLNSSMLLNLTSGRLTAKVSEPGHGFTVSTPHGNVTDLGTEFGVSAMNDATEVRVFVGRVQVNSTENGHDKPVILVAGDTAQSDGGRVNMQPTTASATPYVTDIHHIFCPIPTLHSTGEGLMPGGNDPYWQIIGYPGKSQWQPVPAIAFPPYHDYVQNDSKSSWISFASRVKAFPGGTFTFSTTFDLTGFDPSTVQLQVDDAADDRVGEIRLNGKSTGLPTTDDNFTRLHHLVLDRGFVAGINRLDFDVPNTPDTRMGLRVQISGVAKKIVIDR